MKDLADFIKSFDYHTVIIVGVAFWFLNSNMESKLMKIENDLSQLKTEVQIIKTVLVMKEILPAHLSVKE